MSLRGLLLGAPAKANGLCGERKSQDTVGIFRLRKMEHCVLCFDDVAIRSPCHPEAQPKDPLQHTHNQKASMVEGFAAVLLVQGILRRYAPQNDSVFVS